MSTGAPSLGRQKGERSAERGGGREQISRGELKGEGSGGRRKGSREKCIASDYQPGIYASGEQGCAEVE